MPAVERAHVKQEKQVIFLTLPLIAEVQHPDHLFCE